MPSRRRTVVLLAALAFAAGPLERVARAQAAAPGAEAAARKSFEEGKALEDKGDFAGALAKHKEAEAHFASAGVLFHEAYCLEMLGKLRAASDGYERALAEARTEKKPAVESAALARLEPLRPRVPRLLVRVLTKVAGAEVSLDGAPLDAAHLDGKPFPVEPGEHEIAARAPGHAPFAAKVKAPESVTTPVDVMLEPVPTAPKPAEAVTPPPREPERSRSIAVPIATTAGAVALVAGGVVAFLVAGSTQSDARQTCPQKLTCDDERSKVRTFDALALGGFVGGAALGALSIVLWSSGAPTRTGGATGLRVVATPTRVGVAGSF